VVRDLENGQPINSEECSDAGDGVHATVTSMWTTPIRCSFWGMKGVSTRPGSEAEVIGEFGHGVESLPTTARGTLRAVLQYNRHLYAPARQMSEISCQSHLEAAVSLNSSTLPHVLSVTAKTS
jgi:hypothetical protein